MSAKVAVVTGSNKGIGIAIVKELCKRVGVVYLTARDEARGKEAVAKLKNEGFTPQFHQLEVTDRNSVKAFSNYLKVKYGGLSILVNNAGVLDKDFLHTTNEDSKYVIDVNYRSLLIIQEYLFPILKDNARVVNMSSDSGHISNIRNEYWIKRLTKKDIKVEDINAFVDWFLDAVKKRIINKDDFHDTALLAYRVSKIAVCALTRIQAMEVGRGISVNSLNPGFAQTDMTKHVGDMTAEKAAENPAFLALDVDQSVTGRYFWCDKTERDWADANLKLFDDFLIFERYLIDAGVEKRQYTRV